MFAPGAIQQQQAQSQLDAARQTSTLKTQFPFWELGQLGSVFNQLTGGSSVNVGPNAQGTK